MSCTDHKHRTDRRCSRCGERLRSYRGLCEDCTVAYDKNRPFPTAGVADT
jgi:NMD protein affecting ribosome stability and mRNA decay